MGFGSWIGKLAEFIQKWDALWGKVPKWLRVLIMGALPSGTFIATFFSGWTYADIWFASIGTLFAVVFGFVGVQLGLAKAAEIRRGPPTPAPELSINIMGGKRAILEITNSGGEGLLRVWSRIISINGAPPENRHKLMVSSLRIKKGDTGIVQLAECSDTAAYMHIQGPSGSTAERVRTDSISREVLLAIEIQNETEIMTLLESRSYVLRSTPSKTTIEVSEKVANG